MKTKNACILLLAALALTACKYDDSALWEQVNQNTERIAALEAWQAETNTNIQSLQTLLNTADYITAVTPVTEEGVEVGYTISFLNSDPVTIYNGEKGEKGDTGDTGAAGATPQIGVTQAEDGNWYWTLNGELLTDADGNSIRANGEKGEQGDKGDTGDTGAQGPQGDKGEQGDTGDTGATDTSAPVPQLKTGASLTNVTQDTQGDTIKPEAIYLSVDGGETWTRVSGEDGTDGKDGEDGTDGDSFFRKVDTSDPTCVIFTLAGGTTTFSVPRYTGIKLNFDTQAVHLGYGNTQTVKFTAEGSESFTTDNLFTVAPDGWKAEVTLPTRAATEFILKVTAPTDAASGAAEGEILVMLDNQQGSTTIGRIKADCKDTYLVMENVTAGALATKIGSRTNLTRITVTGGTLNKDDWEAIKKSISSLQTIDLAGATYEGTDKDNLVYKTQLTLDRTLKTVKLPQGITALGENAFNGCAALTSITLPDEVTSIGEYAFNNCYALTPIDLPDGVTSIGLGAFQNCTALTTVTLPETLTSIGNNAFASCTSLTSIDLPAGVTSIGDNAFEYCTALTSITLPDGVTSIGTYTFYNCKALESIDLPEGLTSIGLGAFQNCKALKSIDLPEGLASIGESAFYNCTSLTSIDLPEGVTSIGYKAFYECYGLKSITLPEGLISIGDYAFYKCDVLESVTCKATLPPTLSIYAFSPNLKAIYVPASSVEAYKEAAYWRDYADKIQPIQ